MSPAMIGLAGVIVGAALAVINAHSMEHAKNRRRARASARLLESELWEIAGRARLLARELQDHQSDRDGWARANQALSMLPSPALWADHRSVLAETLSNSDWQAVAGAYERIELLRAQASGSSEWDRWNADGPGRGLLGRTLWSRSIVGDHVDIVESGARALAQLAGRSLEHAPGDERDRLLGIVSSDDTRYAAPDVKEASGRASEG